MHSVKISEARARLSQLVDKAASGEDVVLSRNGKPLVRITRFDERKTQAVRFGVLKGKLTVPRDLDAQLPDEVLGGFQGR